MPAGVPAKRLEWAPRALDAYLATLARIAMRCGFGSGTVRGSMSPNGKVKKSRSDRLRPAKSGGAARVVDYRSGYDEYFASESPALAVA